MAGSKKNYVCNIFKNDISVICVTNIARGKNVWHKNIIVGRSIFFIREFSGGWDLTRPHKDYCDHSATNYVL